MSAVTLQVFREVAEERQRQERFVDAGKFPFTCAASDAPGDYKLAVLTEEVGEVARALLTASGYETDGGDLRKELIQVAAVAVAWAEALT